MGCGSQGTRRLRSASLLGNRPDRHHRRKLSLGKLKYADASRRDEAWYYFRLLEPDFTPLPVYGALREYLTRGAPR